MSIIDDAFLVDCGLTELTEEERGSLSGFVEARLEVTVGYRLCEGLADEQLDEFESLLDGGPEVVEAWLGAFATDYAKDELFLRMEEEVVGASTSDVLSEYALAKWLGIHRPAYSEVVRKATEEIREEIRRQSRTLLSRLRAVRNVGAV